MSFFPTTYHNVCPFLRAASCSNSLHAHTIFTHHKTHTLTQKHTYTTHIPYIIYITYIHTYIHATKCAIYYKPKKGSRKNARMPALNAATNYSIALYATRHTFMFGCMFLCCSLCSLSCNNVAQKALPCIIAGALSGFYVSHACHALLLLQFSLSFLSILCLVIPPLCTTHYFPLLSYIYLCSLP